VSTSVPAPDDGQGEPGGDQGKYEERTVLAWHRTALSITAGALIQLRLTYGKAPGWLLGVIIVAALLSVVAVAESRHRYPGVTSGRSAVVDRGGRLSFLLTFSVILLMTAELAVVLTD